MTKKIAAALDSAWIFCVCYCFFIMVAADQKLIPPRFEWTVQGYIYCALASVLFPCGSSLIQAKRSQWRIMGTMIVILALA